MTAIDHRDYDLERRETSPLSRVIVFGITSLAFALFPAPTEAALTFVLPTLGTTLTTWLTWGLVVLWLLFALKLALSGEVRRTV